MLSPDLLHALAAMGHGDRIVLVDTNYPATRGRRLIQLPGIDMPRALQAVLSVFITMATEQFPGSRACVLTVRDCGTAQIASGSPSTPMICPACRNA